MVASVKRPLQRPQLLEATHHAKRQRFVSVLLVAKSDRSVVPRRVLVSTESYIPKTSESTRMGRSSPRSAAEMTGLFPESQPILKLRLVPDPSRIRFGKRLSPWVRSGVKRVFDCVCVISILPILIPAFLIIGLAVRLTSAGP